MSEQVDVAFSNQVQHIDTYRQYKYRSFPVYRGNLCQYVYAVKQAAVTVVVVKIQTAVITSLLRHHQMVCFFFSSCGRPAVT